MRRSEEDQIQKAVVEYLRTAFPDFVTFSIPNGSNKSRAQAGLFKATGLLAGMPDLGVLMPGRVVFMEIKASRGSLTKSQQELFPEITGLGHPVWVCRSVDDVADVMRQETARAA